MKSVLRKLVRSLQKKPVDPFADAGPENALATEYVRWAYRIILGREPENEEVLRSRRFDDVPALMEAFVTSTEFRQNNPKLTFNFDRWVITETKYGFRLWVSLFDLAISRLILLDKYDEPEVPFVLANVMPGARVLDIGANIGFYSMLMGSLVGPSGRVVAFEPLAFLSDALERSVAENRYENIIQLHRVGLSDKRGEGLLRHAPGTINFGGAHIVAGNDVPAAHVDERIVLQPLDDFLDPDRRTSFVKLDVEGAEPLVIAGGMNLLRRDRPLVLSELHNPQLAAVCGSSANDVIATMSGIGYRCFALRGGTPDVALSRFDAKKAVNVAFIPA